MEYQEKTQPFLELPAEEDKSHIIGQTSMENETQHSASRHPMHSRPPRTEWDPQQLGGRSLLQLDFQDSQLSPALPLRPSNSQHNFTEYSLLQQTDLEFAPLRECPDMSVASERLLFTPRDRGTTSQASERGSLSQHPLAQATILSEDTESCSSNCSLSEHSISPGDETDKSARGRLTVTGHAGVKPSHSHLSREGTGSVERYNQTPFGPPDKPKATVEDTSFLSGEIPARHLFELLQKDVGMPSGSSSAVSMASETSVNRAMPFLEASSRGGVLLAADMDCCETARRQCLGGEEEEEGGGGGGGGASSLPPDQLEPLSRRSTSRMSEIQNITVRSSGSQQDDSSEALHRELLLEIERNRGKEDGGGATPLPKAVTANVKPSGSSTGRPSTTRGARSVAVNPPSTTWGVRSEGHSIQQGHVERELWSSGSQMGIDGSFLSFHPKPVSQSTPGVFHAPVQSGVKAPVRRLSAIESNTEASYQSAYTAPSLPARAAMPDLEATDPDGHRCGVDPSPQQSAQEVQALPCLNYLQKVDAWRANQNSGGKSSLFENLSLQVSPKQRALDNVSEQPLHTDTHSLPLSRSVPSSPRRGEAAGSAPGEEVTYGAGGGRGPPTSLLGHSQSHSSLSTVVTSVVQTEQQEQEEPQDASTLCDLSLGGFHYVPSNPQILFSPQESCYSSANVYASAAASSVVSLEVDNYAPYWNSKPRSPSPREPELNIEDRIPLYLLNLGIDQSPSTILTPFGPRGPIREPEFSPTSLCTVKGGSRGTSSKSTQPSEGDSPHKGNYSRSSLLSVGSSASIPLSVDSLHPAMGPPEQGHCRPTPPPDSAPNPGLHPPASGPALQQQQRESSTVELADRFESSADSSFFTEAQYRDMGAGLPPGGSGGVAQKNQDSLVGSRTLQDIRLLLGPAENIVPGRSPSSSSGGTGTSSHPLHSEDDLMMLLRRCKTLQDSSFTSSSMGDPKRLSSLSSPSSSVLWGRSSSDSMLTSERLRESYSEARGGMLSRPAEGFSASSGAGMRPGDGGGDTNGDTGTTGGGGGNAAAGTGVGGGGTGTAAATGAVAAGGVGGGAGGGGVSSSLVSQPTRRAEPEGCSAAPHDALGPLRSSGSPATKPLTSGGQSRLAAPLTHSLPEQLDQNAESSPEQIQSPAEIPPPEEEAELVNSSHHTFPLPTVGSLEQGGGLSDGGGSSSSSSGGSLAARVTSLLQRESPATMVCSSLASTADLEESRAREWIKLKVSGQQCEPLQLNMVDRQRIEEIKRELLLSTRSFTQSQGSSDAERSQSSVGQSKPEQATSKPAQNQHLHQGEFAALKAAEQRVSQRIQQLMEKHPDPGMDLIQPLMLDLEARVLEIALREGLSLGRPYTPPLTSITIATCRRADTPTLTPPLSPAPELLHVTQLSADGVSLPAAQGQLPQQTQEEGERSALPQVVSTEQDSAAEAYSSPHTGGPPQEAEEPQLGGPVREEALGGGGAGGQQEQPLSLETEKVMERVPTQQQWSRDSGPPQHADSSPGLASVLDPPIRPDHVSHLHLTLSSKALGVPASGSSSSSRLQAPEFVPLRPSSSTYTLSSLDRGGPALSTIGSQDSWEPSRRHDRPNASVQNQPTVATTSGFPQCFTPPQRLAGPSSRPLANHTPAVPVLLPYKPPGSEEFFYVPQTEALPSPICSDTTMESSHPGSDDAVPPSFSAEVLGTRDQEQLGAPGVDIKHTEGLYSKKRKGGRYSNMHPSEPSIRGSRMSYDEGYQTTNMSKAWTKAHPAPSEPRRDHNTSHPAPTGPRRDQGTTHSSQPEDSEEYGPLHVEMDYSMDPGSTDPAPQQTGSLVDQLWNRFSERWGLEEPYPINEREALLVERLAHLSRLLDSRGMTLSEAEEVAKQRPTPPPDANDPPQPRGRTEDRGLNKGGRKKRSTEEDGGSRKRRGDDRGRRENVAKEGCHSSGRREEARRAGPRQAWTLESQVQTDSEPTPPSVEQQQQQQQEEEEDRDDEEGSVAESLSSSSSRQSSSQSRHLCPAERDVSETGSSVSTVDTARLIRAFGAYRVRGLKTGDTGTLDAMNKLYNTIDKQRKSTEQRKSMEQRKSTEQRKNRGKSKEKAHNIPPQTTDTSTVTADSATSSDTYTLPSLPDPVHKAPRSRKPVRLVSKSIQTGDLEIVINATRRHTRDVGTTFPSPGQTSGPRGSVHKERRSKRSQTKVYPQAVSWFVSAEHLRAEARKENEPEQPSVDTPSEVWFETHGRTRAWRDPLRQRQLHDDRDNENHPRNVLDPEPEPVEQTGVTSALVRVSLQEALELRRPEFISQSRERSKRLALLVEERKLQEVLDREREKLFNWPSGPPSRLPLRPAGPVLSKRAVPKKEMVQRSRSIYEQLPEVQKRREEERRKAEYRSYRLNAQLYNKRVTNRVLGRRMPWQ